MCCIAKNTTLYPTFTTPPFSEVHQVANAVSLLQKVLPSTTTPKINVKVGRDRLYNAEDILQKQARDKQEKEMKKKAVEERKKATEQKKRDREATKHQYELKKAEKKRPPAKKRKLNPQKPPLPKKIPHQKCLGCPLTIKIVAQRSKNGVCCCCCEEVWCCQACARSNLNNALDRLRKHEGKCENR